MVQGNYLFKRLQQLLKTIIQANHVALHLSVPRGQTCPYVQLGFPTLRNYPDHVWEKLDGPKRHLGILQMLAVRTHSCHSLCWLCLHTCVWFSGFNTMLQQHHASATPCSKRQQSNGAQTCCPIKLWYKCQSLGQRI